MADDIDEAGATVPVALDPAAARDTDGKQVCRIALRFSGHGEGPGIELDDRQRRLLGR